MQQCVIRANEIFKMTNIQTYYCNRLTFPRDSKWTFDEKRIVMYALPKGEGKKLLHNWYSSWLPPFPESNPPYFPYRIHIHAFEIYDAVQARNCMKMNATAAKNECERLVSRSIVTEWIVSVEWKTVEQHSAHTIIHRTMRLLRALNKSQIFHSLWLLLPLPANVILHF